MTMTVTQSVITIAAVVLGTMTTLMIIGYQKLKPDVRI